MNNNQSHHETCSHKDLSDKIDSLDQRLAIIEANLERQKGFIGGILFVGCIIAYFISNAKEMMGWFK